MSKLKDKYSYPYLNVQKKKHADWEKLNKISNIPMVSNQLVGIEIEVENVECSLSPYLEFYWKETEDGSLRNYGREYTSIPLKGEQIETALHYLWKQLPEDHEFSNRTSVHVHLNVRELEEEQLIAFVILYSIFEKHFFKFAHTKREASMFCVPLYKTILLRWVKETVNLGMSRWSKYSALNILPICQNNDTGCYGTVEFRHLHGNLDPTTILPFINSIYCLYNYVQKNSLDSVMDFLQTANSTSGYIQKYSEIFGQYMHKDLTSEDLEFCISVAKKNLFFNHVSSKLTQTEKQLVNYCNSIESL